MTPEETQREQERLEALERELRERANNGDQRRLASAKDYVFDKSQEKYWDIKNGTLHTEKAVDASIPQIDWRRVTDEASPSEGDTPRRGRPRAARERIIRPSQDILRAENNQFVESSVWWPGEPQFVKDWMINAEGMLFKARGARLLNVYREPPVVVGDPAAASRWVAHVVRLWPEPLTYNWFFDYCAHMMQRPGEKCNAGIVLGGAPGIGKDAALCPLKMALEWNVKDIGPDDVLSDFNSWVQTVLLVINEVRATQTEFHATDFYNKLLPVLAAPPDLLRLNDKSVKARYVKNLLRVVMTTNDPMAMFIPADDRRLFIMQSSLTPLWHVAAGMPNYFAELFGWIEGGGWQHVAAWLAARDISKFNPKAKPPVTRAKDAITGSWVVNIDDAVGFALERLHDPDMVEKLGEPEVLFLKELIDCQFDRKEEMEQLARASRKLPFRMRKSGYVLITLPEGEGQDGRWYFPPPKNAPSGTRGYRTAQAYARECLSPQDALAAVRVRGAKLAGHPVPRGGAGGLSLVAA